MTLFLMRCTTLTLLALCVCASADKYVYNETLAKQAIRFSSAAYCSDRERLEVWACESCAFIPHFQVIHVFEDSSTGAHGFLGLDNINDRIVLAFRGTTFADFGTIWDDIKFTRTSFHDVGVDEGFLKYYLSVSSGIRKILSRLVSSYPDMDVLITGHSLGAGIAQLAAFDLIDIVPNPIVYTFGTPRVGNFDFAQLYRKRVSRSMRVVHNADIVAHLPPCAALMELPCIKSSFFPYHVPEEQFYNEDMTSYQNCSSTDGEDEKCSNQLVFPVSIKNHLTYFGIHVGSECNHETSSNSHIFYATHEPISSNTTENFLPT